MRKNERMLFRIMVSLFCSIWIIFPIGRIFFKPIYCEIFYDSGEVDENGIDTIYIQDVSAEEGIVKFLQNKTNNVEFNEDKKTYYWYGDREEVKLSFLIQNTSKLRFKIGYYPKKGYDNVSKEAKFSVVFDNKEEIYYFSDMDQKDSQILIYKAFKDVRYFLIMAGFFFAVFYLIFVLYPKTLLRAKEKELLIFFFAMCMKRYWTSFFPDYLFHVRGDSPTYVIESMKELSWWHRMPVYQIFLFTIRKLLGEKGIDEALFYTAVANIQMLLGVFSCIIFYWILKKLCKREWLAIMGALLYAAQPCIVNYEIEIMTEALAIDMMIVWIYFLVCFLQNPSKKIACGIGIYSLVMTLTRPSFLILFPILFVFWGIRLLCEKVENPITYWGIGGLAFSSILLWIYCIHNQTLTGQFMLSDVSFNNQCAILIENNLYENRNYPEIVALIDEKIEEGKDNSLAIAKYVLWETEYNGTQYMRDTIRQNANAYMKALLRGWNNNKYMYIHELKDFACSDRMIGEISCIQRILLPFSFIMTFILCLLEFCIGIIIWCMNKKVPYVNVGFPVLIISIMVLSFGTLTHATPQRICIHMLPAVLLMVFYMIEQGLNRVEKVAIKGESK